LEDRAEKAKIVLVLGLVGIAGVLLTIISDFILIGRPNSSNSFLKLGTESMAYLPSWRITAGAFIGIIVLPFQLAGLTSVFQGLKPSGRVMPLVVVIVDAHALIMGVAFHISYAYIGTGWKLYHQSGPGNEILSELVKKFDFYWKIIVFIMLFELLASSIIYMLLIIRGKTWYPKWMAVFNPLCVSLLIFPLIYILPAPIGGFIGPAYFNISTLAFMSLSTCVIYKTLKGTK
jgi:hypothetical protein